MGNRNGIRFMNQHRTWQWLAAAGVIAALQMAAFAAELSTNGNESAVQSGSPSGGVAQTGPSGAGAPTRSAGIEDVLKMLQAGVAKDVVVAYIQHAPIRYRLTPADLIALKEQAVPDEVTLALIKRGAELAGPGGPGTAGTSGDARELRIPARLAANARPGVMDPESYDFWWYHYAYPRALAAANQRVLSSYAQLPPNLYYLPPLPYPPRW